QDGGKLLFFDSKKDRDSAVALFPLRLPLQGKVFIFDAIKPEDRVPTSTVLAMGIPTIREEKMVALAKSIAGDPSDFVSLRRRRQNNGMWSDKVAIEYKR